MQPTRIALWSLAGAAASVLLAELLHLSQPVLPPVVWLDALAPALVLLGGGLLLYAALKGEASPTLRAALLVGIVGLAASALLWRFPQLQGWRMPMLGASLALTLVLVAWPVLPARLLAVVAGPLLVAPDLFARYNQGVPPVSAIVGSIGAALVLCVLLLRIRRAPVTEDAPAAG